MEALPITANNPILTYLILRVHGLPMVLNPRHSKISLDETFRIQSESLHVHVQYCTFVTVLRRLGQRSTLCESIIGSGIFEIARSMLTRCCLVLSQI